MNLIYKVSDLGGFDIMFHQVHTKTSLLSVALACSSGPSLEKSWDLYAPNKVQPLRNVNPMAGRIGRLFLPNRDKLLLKSNNLMKHPGVHDFEGVGVVLPKHQKECLDGWFPFKWYYCLGAVPKGLAKSKHVLVPFESVSNI